MRLTAPFNFSEWFHVTLLVLWLSSELGKKIVQTGRVTIVGMVFLGSSREFMLLQSKAMKSVSL
jgi:hypothetical protein